MASYDYKGTKITGTSVTGTVFKNSGVSSAKVNDTYLNTKTGNVYKCTDRGTPTYTYKKTTDKKLKSGKLYFTRRRGADGKWMYTAVQESEKKDTKPSTCYERSVSVKAGTPTKAKWAYIRTDIIAVPSETVSSLAAIKRSNYAVSTSWRIPSAMTDVKSGSRATGLRVKYGFTFSYSVLSAAFIGKHVALDEEAKKTGYNTVTASVTKNLTIDTTQHSFNLNSITPTKFSADYKSQKFTRDDFYPIGSLVMKSAFVSVYGRNAKGNGSAESTTLEFAAPSKPTIETPTHDKQSGTVSFKITPAKETDKGERYDTRYIRTVYDSRTKQTATYDSAVAGANAFTVEYDVVDRQLLQYGEYVKVTVEAFSRGYGGDSAKVSSSIVIGYPAQATIGSVDVPNPGDDSSKATVKISTNHKAEAPVDGVRLQALVDTRAATAQAANNATDASWEDLDAVDDGQCTALAASVGELRPSAGRFTWIRVKTWNDFEDMFYRYSAPTRVKALESPEPTAADDEIAILSQHAADNGLSVVVLLGWDADGEDDSTHTELSWASSEDAWRSTEQPSTFDLDDATWDEGPVTHDGTTYGKSATVTIKNLDEGKAYYISARRWQEVGDDVSYGPYCQKVVITPVTAPESVVLSVPNRIQYGAAARFAWYYDTTAMQQSWRLMLSDQEGDKVIMEGDDPLNSCSVPWERLEPLIPEGGVLDVYVAVSAGGAEVVSEIETTSVAYAPILEADVPAVLQAQPLSIGLSCSESTADVSIVVKARGSYGSRPSGRYSQPEGATVWSDVVTPNWQLENDTNTATIEAPSKLEFRDLASYDVTIVATDRATGLQSESIVESFAVAWAHQAPAPSDAVQIEPYDTTDGSGMRSIGALIRLDGTFGYEPTEDATVEEGKAYFAFETSYRLTDDAEIVEGKEYYEYSEGEYTLVAEPTEEGLPSYYEKAEGYADADVAVGDDATGLYERTVLTPVGAVETDMYDVYRVTPDGADLIASGRALDAVVNDPYAPFGSANLRYRVALRTADGDEEWRDFGYTMDNDRLRLDWGGRYVELRYSLDNIDKYKKDSEVVVHADGSTAVGLNPGTLKSGSVSAAIIEVSSYDESELVRDMAQYAGTVLVRLPNGECYLANAEVPSIGGSLRSPVVAVQLETIRVDMAEPYLALGEVS